MEMSNEINEIAAALSLAQGEIENPSKDSSNPFFKSKYADLSVVLEAVRPCFSKYDLAVMQFPGRSDSEVTIETLITHKSGQWMRGVFSLPLQSKGNIAQEAGSLITYLRRYCLAAAAGVFQEDNDGNLGKSKADNTGDVVVTQEVMDFSNKMIKAIEDEDYMFVGRATIAEHEMLINMIWPKGQKTKLHAKMGHLIDKYKSYAADFVDALESARDDSELSEALGELTDKTDKTLIWSKLTQATKDRITNFKEAA